MSPNKAPIIKEPIILKIKSFEEFDRLEVPASAQGVSQPFFRSLTYGGIWMNGGDPARLGFVDISVTSKVNERVIHNGRA